MTTHHIRARRVAADLYDVIYTYPGEPTRYSERGAWSDVVALARKCDADEIHVDRRACRGEGEGERETVTRKAGFVQTFELSPEEYGALTDEEKTRHDFTEPARIAKLTKAEA
jgi:hypothetical protein